MPKRVFSGARPTGRQHIGNYLGAIQNYVKLQSEYDCIYCIVDIHALTSLEDTSQLPQMTRELALDWLAAGIDPEEEHHVRSITRSGSGGIAYVFEHDHTFGLAAAGPDV